MALLVSMRVGKAARSVTPPPATNGLPRELIASNHVPASGSTPHTAPHDHDHTPHTHTHTPTEQPTHSTVHSTTPQLPPPEISQAGAVAAGLPLPPQLAGGVERRDGGGPGGLREGPRARDRERGPGGRFPRGYRRRPDGLPAGGPAVLRGGGGGLRQDDLRLEGEVAGRRRAQGVQAGGGRGRVPGCCTRVREGREGLEFQFN